MAYDLEGNKKFKNETIKMTKDSDVKVEFENAIDGQVTYESKGNDIIVTAYAQNGGVVDTKKVLGKVTLKNAGTKDIVEDGEAHLYINGANVEDLMDPIKPYALGDATSKKKQTIKGSYLDNEITGGAGDDTVYAVGGYNGIMAGQGADKVYAGEGEDIFVIKKGDAVKGDTIYNADADDTLYFDYSDTPKEKVGTTFEKKADDLVVNVQGDNVTLNKFFTAEEPIEGFRVQYSDTLDEYEFGDSAILVNGEETDNHIAQIGNDKKANTLTGTNYKDMIWGGNKNDKIISINIHK